MAKRIGTTAQGFERFDDGGVVQNVETTYVDTEGDGTYAKTHASRLYVWSAGLLDWIRWDGSVTGGGGGGGGGAVTVADGADVAQGTTTDASSANTVVGLLKAIKAFLAGTLTVGGSVSVSNLPSSQNVADGGGSLTVDAPVGTPVWVRLSDGAAAYVGQKVAASSVPVVIASDQSSLPTTEARLPTALVGGRLDVNIGAAGATVGVNPSSETAGVGIGAAADAEAAGSGSAIAVLKRIRTLLGGTLIVSLLNATLRGASTGAPAATDTALVVGIRDDIDVRDRVARLLGHVTVDNASLAVTGSGVFHVDDNAGSLTVDAPVGTPVWVRLSDGAAAFVGQKVAASSIPVVVASDQSALPENLTQIAGVALAAKALPTNADGQVAIPVYVNAQQYATYDVAARAVATGALTAGTAKAVLSIEHALASTKTVRIRRIMIHMIQTTALSGAVDVQITRGTAASSAGSAVTPQPRRLTDPAAEVVVKSLPTITAATVADNIPAGGFASTTTLYSPPVLIYDWQEAGETKPYMLVAGALQSLVINVVSTAAHNLTLTISVDLTEE